MIIVCLVQTQRLRLCLSQTSRMDSMAASGGVILNIHIDLYLMAKIKEKGKFMQKLSVNKAL